MNYLPDLHLFKWKNTQTNILMKKWLPISIVIGIISGILMSFFLLFIQTLNEFITTSFWIPIAVLIAGLITALLSKYGFKEVEGPGIAYIIELKNKKLPVPIRTIITRFFSSGISLGSNMPGGKEGPAFMIGGALAYAVGKRINLSKDDLSLAVTIGSASATSAIFQAPLGGTLFASEVPFKRDIDMDIYLPAFIASIISVITFFLFGRQTLGVEGLNFHFTSSIDLISLDWIVYSIIFGVVIGISSNLYIKAYLLIKKGFVRLGETWKQIAIATVLGSFVILLSGLLFPGRSEFLETGFNLLNKLSTDINLHKTNFTFLLILLLFKASILIFLISGGNSMGIFSPSLVLGGILGLLFSIATGLTVYSDVFFLLGMVGTLAGTAKTPISSMILILEMTGLPEMIIYMAIVSSVAYVFSGETGLYAGQLVDRREALKQMVEEKSHLSIISIESIMSRPVISLTTGQKLGEVKQKFIQLNKHTFPVLDLNQQLIGIVSYDDIKNKSDDLIIDDVMIKKVLTLSASLSLQQVLQEVFDSGVEHFPVLDDNKVIGFVTLRDILRSYFEHESTLGFHR